MSSPDDPLLDDFLREFGAADLLPGLAGQLSAGTPSSSARARMLAAATAEGRFARFGRATADILDLPIESAQSLLDRLSDPATWSPGIVPGMTLFHVQGGPRVQGAITGFVRIDSGAGFPEHEHLGDEEVLVIQGSCLDSLGARVMRAGDRVRMTSGSSHSFHVRPGPDFVYLAVAFTGIRVAGQELRADDPRL